MTEYSQIGFALCCGVPPNISHDMYATCPKCARRRGVWGGLEFLRQVWNTSFQLGRGVASTRREHKELISPVLYQREGWREGNLRIERARFGRTTTHDLNCLFKCVGAQTDHLYAHDQAGYSCAIDEGRHIHDITLECGGNQVTLQWDDRKRYPYSYVYLTTGYSTDGTFNWHVTVHSVRVRDMEQLRLLIPETSLEDVS